MTKIAIIGAGAGGIFCAANSRISNADKSFETTVFEASDTPLLKVSLSGGGRCNIANAESEIEKLIKNYPRGAGSLRKVFRAFSAEHLCAWFKERGVEFVEEESGRIFPKSNSSKTIVDTLLNEAQKCGAKILKHKKALGVKLLQDSSFEVSFSDNSIFHADKILIAAGSLKKDALCESIKSLGHTFSEPLPSLFAFKAEGCAELAGLSLQDTLIEYCGKKKIIAQGALLFTHEGLSGPAVLKLSSYGAVDFAQENYQFKISINFLNSKPQDFLKKFFDEARISAAKKLIKNHRPENLQENFWLWVLKKSAINSDTIYANLNKDSQNKIIKNLTGCEVFVLGKSVNKSEFVTCGGVKLQEVDFATMQSKIVKNLYFAGEYLDMDAITGGFNLQAAFASAKIASSSIYKTDLT